MTRVEKAIAFSTQAQGDLDAALAAGTDTAEARERLNLAEQELKEAQAADMQAQVAGAGEIRVAVAKAVADELNAATEAVNASLAAMSSISPPSVTLCPGPLENLIAARLAHQEALAATSAHQGRVNELKTRLATLNAERQAIANRRAQGVRDDAVDGPKLALLNSDMEGLRSLIERAQAEAPVGLQSAAAEVDRLQADWRREQNDAVALAMNRYCTILETRLIDSATQLAKVYGPFGHVGLRWQPSQQLRTAVLRGVF